MVQSARQRQGIGCAGALCLAASLLAPAPASAGVGIDCSYSSATDVMTATMTPDRRNTLAQLFEDGTGRILLEGEGCDDGGGTFAELTNTDLINLVNGSPLHGLFQEIHLATPFTPGDTDEPGGSDEIEMRLDLGDAGGWLRLNTDTSPGASPLNVVGGERELNLNAGEGDGVDADLTVLGRLRHLSFEGGGGADIFDLRGGSGTPDAPFHRRTLARGNSGADSLTGTPRGDGFGGGPQGDTIRGLSGNDEMVGNGGADSLDGGRGRDILFGDGGNDVLRGGRGYDRCEGGSGHDVFRSCEEKTQGNF